MTRSAKVTLDWADGEYSFRLGIKEIEELQEKTGCGPFFLLNRLVDGSWKVQDIRETIRLGLIGGGMEPVKALPLVRNYVDGRPLLESVKFAQLILSAALAGAPDGERPGKAGAVKGRAKNSQTEGSPLPLTTEPALQ
jgi:hypothetical protein